jgi:hypothetical protein
MVNTLTKDALNLPSPEELTTYHQAVAEITRKSAQKTKPERQYW